MSRRSACLQGVAKVIVEDTFSNASDDDEFHDVDEDEEIEAASARKKNAAKLLNPLTPPRRIRKSREFVAARGILSSLRELPLDVVAEIFGHLNPLDLLNLARTTKEIRGILMSRSSIFIWKESRSHVEGLPEPPRELSEPQYANLCFSTHCHQCLAVPVSTIIWSARLRLCKKCIEAKFDNQNNVAIQTSLEYDLISSLVPVHREVRRRGRWGHYQQELFSIDVATRLSKECEAFREKGCLQTSDPEYKAWFKQKEDEMKEIDAHAALCTAWAANRTSERRNELDEARSLRLEAIVERLTALGWGEEVPFHTYELSCHKLVKQPKELTDRIWKNIETPLVEFLTGLKEERLVATRAKIIRERRQLAARVYNKWRETLPPDVVYPAKIDVLLTEPFRAVIEDTPIEPEEKVTEESFDAAVSSVVEFSADWRRRKQEELVKIMQKIHPDSVEADLHLATTFFTCSTYTNAEPLSTSTILVHASATAIRYGEWGEDSVQKTLGEEAWNAAGRVRLHEQAQRNARFVVEACGLDPDVTTSAEMDEINPALECLNCSNEMYGRCVMRWTRAAYHVCGSTGTPWKCLNVNEERLLEAEERQALENYSNVYFSYQESYCCKVCGNSRRMMLFTLKSHLLTEHNIPDITFENLAFALDVGPNNRFPQPILLKRPKEIAEGPTATDKEVVVGSEAATVSEV
ncbi:hypothetical protein MSAN_00379100 [Mycena sanguinolenta]|uniref:F-box domain-containing protein n=1 Tax=Mycena sanguinolenta TaxID=230812 RepID=A0A8H6ZFZ4_9AGAR|nr:hypothetical protein MSAN_00379100 [Mycena sanguinolenta]